MNVDRHGVAVCAVVAALSTAISAPVQADHYRSYFGIEGSILSLDQGPNGGPAADSTPAGVRVKLGTRINRYLDLEGQLGGGTDNSGFQSPSVDAVFGGLYVKGTVPIGFGTTLFGLAGVGSVGLSQGFNNTGVDEVFTDFSFGAGIETFIADRIDFTADFISYGSDEDDVFDNVFSVNFGVKLYY